MKQIIQQNEKNTSETIFCSKIGPKRSPKRSLIFSLLSTRQSELVALIYAPPLSFLKVK
jgi:hypothetical protein